MATQLDDHDPTKGPKSAPLGRRPVVYWLTGAAAAAALIVGIVVATNGGDGSDDAELAGPPLELSLGEGDALASCLPFEVDILAGMSPAFAATATAVDGDTVTLAVDKWYTGGDAAEVRLLAPHGMQALIAGFDFEVGQQYLITAAEGSVNYCGYSGLATPEMTAAFEKAFPG